MTAPQDPFATPSGDPAPPRQPAADGPDHGTPAYGDPGPAAFGTPVPTAPRNGLGTAALVLGLLSVPAAIFVVGGFVLGIPAIILGALGRGRAKRRQATNGGVALTGLILGVVGVLLSALYVGFLNTERGQNLIECIGEASTRAEQEQCAEELVA